MNSPSEASDDDDEDTDEDTETSKKNTTKASLRKVLKLGSHF